MFFETLASWILLLIFLIPLIWVGAIITVKTTTLRRIELIIPCSAVLGISLLIFFLNVTAFFIKGEIGIIFSYFALIIFGFLLLKIKNGQDDGAYGINRKRLVLFLLSLFSWGFLIFWKGNKALIGSDSTLYYSIAHSFLRGNFPPLTPWQSDLALSYHLGIFEFLGAAHLLTNINFEFLHIFFSSFFIICASQIIIWIRKVDNFRPFLLGNLAVGLALISFGFINITLPYFPIKFPEITNFHQAFLWVRGLPSVYDAIEIYGAVVNLDSLIYFIFHSFGLALFLALVVVIIHPKKYQPIFSLLLLLVGLSVLALSNESIFIAAAPALILSFLIICHREKILLKNIKLILITLFLTAVIIVVQGGAITANLLTNSTLNSSVLFFPKKEQIKEDFQSYHYSQMVSKQLSQKREWMPLSWYHVGVDVLAIVALLLVSFRLNFRERIIALTFFSAGIFSLLSYNFIVPKYLIANGNRFLTFAYIFLSLSIIYSLISFVERLLSKGIMVWGAVLLISVWILAPTILPPLALLSKTRFGENKLIPRAEQPSAGIEWIRNNLPYNEKVMVLDLRAPHPSGAARAMVQAGVFSPIFSGDFRAYTIEASPQYIDIAYTLSPLALKELKISTILIDSYFYQTLPKERQNQLDNEKYFRKIFDYSNNRTEWERVYRIQEEYLKNGGELAGTLKELSRILPKGAKIYIDNEENFKYDFLRRPTIFILRDRDLYFNPQSGVYLNVEAYINQKNPDKNIEYDFLVLGNTTNPDTVCECGAEPIWQGLKNQVVLWRSEYFGKEEK